MNRETKIGLITGVTLIVLIGAMLSSYLSAPHNSIGDLSLAGQGSQLRNQISNPVGIASVPVQQGSQGVVSRQVATTPVSQPVVPAFAQTGTRYNQITQLPYGSSHYNSTSVAQSIPKVNPEVIPRVVAQAPTHNGYGPAAPIANNSPPASTVPAVATADTGTPESFQTTMYTVRPGDTLGQIAWHFYHDSGPLAVRRIVSANRGKLGITRAILRVGETLTIPSSGEQVTSTHPQLLSMAAETTGNEYSGNRAMRHSANSAGRHVSARTYRVESGDTLLGIARKLMGAGTEANVHRIMALNNIHDPRKIYVGQILKIPGASR